MKTKNILFVTLSTVVFAIGWVDCNYLDLPVPVSNDFFLPHAIEDWEDMPAIIVDAYKGDYDALKQDILLGSNVNLVVGIEQPHAGVNPLCAAIYSNSYECVKLLLENGARTSIPFEAPLLFTHALYLKGFNARNTFPLHFAIFTNADIRIIKLLIDYGAGVNVSHWWAGPGSRGLTPLMLCITSGNKKAFEVLLKAGADPLITNSIDGLSALDYAHIKDTENGDFFGESFSSILKNHKS